VTLGVLLAAGLLASSPTASPSAEAVGGALRSGPGLVVLVLLIGGLLLLRRRIGRR
jgi:hypothetical protein